MTAYIIVGILILVIILTIKEMRGEDWILFGILIIIALLCSLFGCDIDTNSGKDWGDEHIIGRY